MGERGSIWCRGYNVFEGYYKDDEKNAECFDNDGWFLTGDVATIDEDGYMQITDRVKDVIKSGGEWISTIEIENFAVAHPKISEAAVVGVLHEKWDERPLLLIVSSEKISKEEIFSFLQDKIAKWWMPDDILFLDSLPHTATGKVKKIDLKTKYRDYLVNKN